jgi:iron complex transport system ATP-binding protein
MIDVQHVTKRYSSHAVIDDVSLQIQKGGITSIIGPNGAGKSTLLSIVSRLLKMDAGRVTVDGMDISATAGDVLARRMAILRQDNHFASRLTVEDLVTFGRYPHSKGRPTVEDREHVEESLRYLELEDLRHRVIDELSGGQRQRAFVAMVLCQDTDYVLLDEPLNNLDMKHSVAMMKRLRRITVELGKTVVLVVHDINFASCYSDQIIAMRNGRVAHQGNSGEIMRNSILRDIFDINVCVETINDHPIGVYFT